MFSEQVIASIIDDSRYWMNDVAFRTAPPIGGLSGGNSLPQDVISAPSFKNRLGEFFINTNMIC